MGRADCVIDRAPGLELPRGRYETLQVLIYIADEHDGPVLNELWDAWVPADHPPVRAMVQVGLGKACKVEMVAKAAVSEG